MFMTPRVHWYFQKILSVGEVVEGNGYRLYLRGTTGDGGPFHFSFRLVVQDLVTGRWIELRVSESTDTIQGPRYLELLAGTQHPLECPRDQVDLPAALEGRLDEFAGLLTVPLGNFAAALCPRSKRLSSQVAEVIPTLDQLRWLAVSRGAGETREDAHLVRAMMAVTTALAQFGGRATATKLAAWVGERFGGDFLGLDPVGIAYDFGVLDSDGVNCVFTRECRALRREQPDPRNEVIWIQPPGRGAVRRKVDLHKAPTSLSVADG